MNIPAFNVESALSVSGRGYRMPRMPRRRRITAASGVQAALINQGGGGTNFWCDPDGTCSCLGGSLSQDCWLMQQYCINDLQCGNNPPYKCVCNWKLVRPPGPIFPWSSGGVFTRR